MSLTTQIIDQRVSGIVIEMADILSNDLKLGTDEDKRRSAAFVSLVAKTVLNLTDEEAIDGIVDGGNDFGVDALYFAPPSDGEIRLSLIQGKYKRSLEGDSTFPENGIIKLIEAIGALFDPGKILTLNKRLQDRVEDIRSFVAGGAIPRVVAIAANNGPIWSSAAQQRIDNAKKEFGDQVDWQHVGPDELLLLLQSQKPIDTTLQLIGQALVETFDFRRVMIGRMSVSELARLAENFGDRLLERNIRRYLGLAGNRVNEAVATTLRDPAQRSNFYFYNNGITVTCSQFRHNALQQGNWQVQLGGLQIVNGGQTSKTVQQIYKELGPDIASAHVLVRIYELPQSDDDLVGAITFATNSQNPVDLRDLKANDKRQRILAESIKGLGYEYRLKREDQPLSPTEVTSAVIAEAVLAIWRHRPHQARFAANEHFGALYDIIFKPDLNGAQAVIAALLTRFAENRRKRPPENSPDFLAYGSRFIAMLMGRYLLEDLGISLSALDHRTFDRARKLVVSNGDAYFKRAEDAISQAILPLFDNRERTLQRLSATFRRADLVEILMQEILNGLKG
jgi:hypothetical protein